MSDHSDHLVLAKASGCGLALPQPVVQEVIHYAELIAVPTMPRLLRGFLRLRRELMPVVDTSALLAHSAIAVGLFTPIIVLRGVDQPLALLVDGVVGVVPMPPHDALTVPTHHTFQDCAKASFRWKDLAYSLLDVRRLLTREEHARFRELEAEEHQRRAELLEVRP